METETATNAPEVVTPAPKPLVTKEQLLEVIAELFKTTRVVATKPTLPITAQAKWPFTVGVELTWVATDHAEVRGAEYQYFDYSAFSSMDSRVKNACQTAYESLPKNRRRYLTMHRHGIDCGCVEFPTPILTNWREFSKRALFYTKVMNAVGYRHTAKHIAGGGAHVHVGIPADSEDFEHYLRMDLLARPYIPRAFNYYADGSNAGVLYSTMTTPGAYNMPQSIDSARASLAKCITDKLAHEKAIHATAEAWTEASKPSPYWCSPNAIRAANTLSGSIGQARQRLARSIAWHSGTDGDRAFIASQRNNVSGHAVKRNGEYGTMEFRCFQMPATVAEHELHIAFALAYMGYIKGKCDRKEKTQDVYSKPKRMAIWQYDSEKFLAFIAELGLPVKRYEQYLVNIEMRYSYSKTGKVSY